MGPRQIIIRLPNTPGEMSKVSDILGANGINIKAMSSSVDGGIGILCLFVDDHDKGMLVLRSHNYDISETPVIAAYTPDHPGGLGAVVRPLKDASVNIEKIYLAIARKGELSLVIIEVDDYETGIAALKAQYMDIANGDVQR